MVDFSIPNLCGANLEFNKLINQFDVIKKEIKSGLDIDASELASVLDISFTQLETDLRAMIPQLPALPAINFQAEVTSLAGLAAGSTAYLSKLAAITTQFGSALPDLKSLVETAVGSGGDICGGLPNLQLPSGATEALEKAKNVLQATAAAVEEEAQSFSDDMSEDAVKALYGDAFSRDALSSLLKASASHAKSALEMATVKVAAIQAEEDAIASMTH